MTYDRFDASLRQHLLDTANERPAEGQLAALVEAVADTRQRPSLVARLAWTPGRVGPVPTVAIRYGLIGVALLLAAMAGALLAGGGATPGRSTVFEGPWTSIDPGDGRGQTLVVGAGPTPAIYFEDGYASGSACARDAVKRFTARGLGEISGDRLVASFPDGGGCGSLRVELEGIFDYHTSSDTLVDQYGITWSRTLAEDRPPGTAPSADVTPTEAPGPVDPSPRSGEPTFDSIIHGISINYPAGWQTRAATEPWAGEPLEFASPGADVIFDPAYRDRLHLVLASEPFGERTQDEWLDQASDWLCADGDEASVGSWVIDGADALVVHCEVAGSAALVVTESRGYVIRLVVSSEDDELAATYDWDWLKPALATVDLRPGDAVDVPEPIATDELEPSLQPEP